MKKNMGFFIISITTISFSIIIMLAQISLYIDESSDFHFNSWIYYVPIYVYILELTALAIGIYMVLNSKAKED